MSSDLLYFLSFYFIQINLDSFLLDFFQEKVIWRNGTGMPEEKANYHTDAFKNQTLNMKYTIITNHDSHTQTKGKSQRFR